MLSISYTQMLIAITAIWIIIRAVYCIKNKSISLKKEAMLLLVYVCIVVVVRFTFCPFGKVNGQIQPLLLDNSKLFPLKINLKPLVYLFDYPTLKEVLLNLIGNITMFIPLGIVWPAVFKELNTHLKVIFAGIGVSLTIELLQLPFYSRTTDIDDLLLNSIGFIIGYGIYLLVKKIKIKKHIYID